MTVKRGRPEQKLHPATKAFFGGLKLLDEHPLFAPLLKRADVIRRKDNYCPADGWAVVLEHGRVHVHPTRRGEPDEWAYVLAHCLLHLGFGHFRVGEKSLDWNAACDVVVARFLADLKFGRCPAEMQCELADVRTQDEERLFRAFREHALPGTLRQLGTAGERSGDMFWSPQPLPEKQYEEWTRVFAVGLVASVTSAVRVAGGYESRLGATKENLSTAERARRWFVNSYPLLGALAAAFTIVEDGPVCQRMGISIAAVHAETKEIYVSPAAALSFEEAKFVIAHELLHVGLRHETRRRGRDPQLWNVACDFVINGWLVELGFGDIPSFGGLHDVTLKGLSADSIYDRLAVDLRRNRKLATLRGVSECDMLDASGHDWWARDDAASLDDFYRRALAQGLVYHDEQGRGLLPAALLEEIRALDRPPIPWDVDLARWFDDHFSPVERVRTYARLSRRQELVA
jgi:predicted metal-dependent peptidase